MLAQLKYFVILQRDLACFKYKEQEFTCDSNYVIKRRVCNGGGEWQTRTTETDTQPTAQHGPAEKPAVTFGNMAFESNSIDGYATQHADANLTRTD